MTYLLDTHVWLWLLESPERIAPDLHAMLKSVDNTMLLSAATAWEIAIKWSLGRLPLPEPPGTYVPRMMSTTGALGLAVEHVHALHVAELPRHHGDPFDRLLIAQAQIERVPIVTVDDAFDAYDVEVIKAA